MRGQALRSGPQSGVGGTGSQGELPGPGPSRGPIPGGAQSTGPVRPETDAAAREGEETGDTEEARRAREADRGGEPDRPGGGEPDRPDDGEPGEGSRETSEGAESGETGDGMPPRDPETGQFVSEDDR